MNNSENIQIDSNIKSKRKDFFVIAITLLISIVILILLVNVLMSNSKVNEGKFRTTDVIVSSTAILEDTSDVTKKWTFTVHQSNKISILVVPSIDKFNARIIDIVSTKKGLEIYQIGKEEEKINIGNSDKLDLVTTVNEDGTVLYEIEIINKNVLSNFEIPSETTEITHDATIFNIAGITNEKLEYSLAFKLELQDETGKTSVMNVSLKLPQGDITESGSLVTRQNLSEFVFKVK